MGKDIIVLPSSDEDKTPRIFGDVPSMQDILSEDYQSVLTPDMAFLYDQVSSPNIHIKDKINMLLRLHMFYSKEVLTSANLDNEAVWIYRVRREAVGDLKRMIEVLNEYSSIDNFDINHPLYNKSLSFIIEVILSAVKTHTEIPQFDNVVREVAIALPGVESRVRNMIQDSSTEDILAMRSNPLMDIFQEERELFESYKKNRELFMEYMSSNGADGVSEVKQ